MKKQNEKAIEKNTSWHDLRKNPQDLPKDIKLNEFESYNPLVIIFFYRYDDHGKAAKVYALDRWSGEPFNEWEKASDKWKNVYELTDKQLTKAKELLAKWVELFKPKGGNIPPTPIQVDTEQFLSEVEK